MSCCVPFCGNKSISENTSKSGEVTYHRLPDDVRVRAAWLRALGLQDSPLPDSALVCSQHFLRDDACDTESGSRQLRSDAVPSTVQVCITCLDTDGKMFLMDHKLNEAYEKLTGFPLYDGGNLPQTLCVQCSHRLRSFSTFRDMSLRARSLMMELVKKHELITIKHIKMIQCANNQLKNNLVSTILGPDHCDLNIVEEHSEDRQTDEEETVHEANVKTEHSDYCLSVEAIKEEKSNADCVKEELDEDLIKYQSAPYICTVCFEDFCNEHAYSAHVSMHQHGDVTSADSAHTVVDPLSSRPVKNENEARTIGGADTTQHSERGLVDNSAYDDRASDSGHRTTSDYHRVVKLYDVVKHHKNVVPKQDEALTQTRQVISSRALDRDDKTRIMGCVVKLDDNLKSPEAVSALRVELSTQKLQAVSSSGSVSARAAGDAAPCRAARAHDEPAAATRRTASRARTFACDVCRSVFPRKDRLIAHMRNHIDEKPYSCEMCSFKCKQKGSLVRHIRTHTGEKPYSCDLCSYKCTVKSSLVNHASTHTGEKPYSCEICSFRCKAKATLVNHVRNHTGEKPFACEICSFKCKEKAKLVNHVRTHTGEKPFSCEICSHKFAQKWSLVKHVRTHTGEKRYSCNVCIFKCTERSTLVRHMRTHTGEKPYSCDLCSYKCAVKSSLVYHARTHTGDKPYSCEICGYKCTQKGNLVKHERTHTGKKSYKL